MKPQTFTCFKSRLYLVCKVIMFGKRHVDTLEKTIPPAPNYGTERRVPGC